MVTTLISDKVDLKTNITSVSVFHNGKEINYLQVHKDTKHSYLYEAKIDRWIIAYIHTYSKRS